MPRATPIPVEVIRARFYVDGDGVLRWRQQSPEDQRLRKRSMPADSPAGRLNMYGYYLVCVSYKRRLHKVLAHRIVWVLTYGEWPMRIIDHINRVRTDNRPANLRLVSHLENAQNRSDTIGGLAGAYPNKQGTRFRSQIKCNGRIHYLGTFDSAEEANRVFMSARVSMRNEQPKEPSHG